MKLVSRYDSDTYENGEIFSLLCGHEYECQCSEMYSLINVRSENGICRGFDYIDYRIFLTDREVRRMKLERLKNV